MTATDLDLTPEPAPPPRRARTGRAARAGGNATRGGGPAALGERWWVRVEALTPVSREREVDGLRGLAIAGVILGHWLVTAFVVSGGGRLAVASPLHFMPVLAPVSWVFQTLAVFFLVGGYTGAKGWKGRSYGRWLRRRMLRLARPVPVLLLVWGPLSLALRAAGVHPMDEVLKLVISPLWFLGVYAGLTALTPAVVALWRRLGGWAVTLPVAAVGAVDLVRFGLHGPHWLGWVNLPAGWLVPYLIGAGWAAGAFRTPRTAWWLLGGGTAATALLIAYAGYPASMVGVPGSAISNLNPPTLAAVTFGLAQAGLALLLRGPLARLLSRPRIWAPVALANLSAMTLFLWHQTAMMLATIGLLAVRRLPGLHTVPDGPGWVAARLVWLPVFAAVLTCCWALFHRFERSR
jgi:hypothetical protein